MKRASIAHTYVNDVQKDIVLDENLRAITRING